MRFRFFRGLALGRLEEFLSEKYLKQRESFGRSPAKFQSGAMRYSQEKLSSAGAILKIGFRQNTDRWSTDPLTDLPTDPYKINGKMNTAYLSLNNPF